MMPHPISGDVQRALVFRVDHTGGHITARVFIGQENAPEFAGLLTFRPDEWREFERNLRLSFTSTSLALRIDYEGDTEAWLEMLRLQKRAAS